LISAAVPGIVGPAAMVDLDMMPIRTIILRETKLWHFKWSWSPQMAGQIAIA